MVEDNPHVVTMYLGLTLEQWKEFYDWYRKNNLRTHADLVNEVVHLRGKVSFYESRIADMHSRIR